MIKKKYNKPKFKVFLDPGHGGKDSGAISQKGTQEKKITLNFAKRLSNYLQSTGKVKVILSRDKDIYLSLNQRRKLIKINQPDIFISLHADASSNKNASGISVFSLSENASDKEAEKLADRENKENLFEGVSLPINDDLVLKNLIKMFQRQVMNQSAELANVILDHLHSSNLSSSRGHRFAGFAVLKSAEIPSVLIELGFITNLVEEKKLLDNRYLKKITKSIGDSIIIYLDKKNFQ